ncbi:MAG: UvrD-helicase domain-containing protein [Syntrophobacteraceae bacterium]
MAKSELLGASAGSGKTYSLIERTYEAILCQTPLVIAVTFTRAATAEMRKRILERVDRADLDYVERLRQITRAGAVRFSTFDSFFYQLLAAIGDPVEIADEKQTSLIREKIARAFFDQIQRADKAEEITIACRLLGASIENLTDDLAESRLGRFAQNDISGERFTKIIVQTARLKAEVRRLQGEFQSLEPEERFTALKKEIGDLRRADLSALVKRAAFTHASLSGFAKLGSKIPWTASPYADIDRIFRELREILAAYLRNRALLRELTLTQMHRVYQIAAKNIKQKERKIFFEDILDRLIALDGKEALQRTEVAGLYFELGLDRVGHLLIDEFQDTSRDNLELIFPLVEDILAEVGEEGQGDRSLFIVGDWKQMIYAWRGADRQAVEERLSPYLGAQLQRNFLPCNWRSTPLLIELFNSTVSRIFSGSGPSELQLVPSGKQFECVSEINLYKVSVANKEKTPFFERMIEAIQVKKLEWGCDYSDITLIFRTNTEKESMAQKLIEAGIGFAEVRGRQILSSEEGVALFCLLSYLFAGDGSLFFKKALEASCLSRGLLAIAEKKQMITSRYGMPFGLQPVADVLEMCRGIAPDAVIETFQEEAEAFFRAGGNCAEEFLAWIFKVRDKVTVPEPARSDRVKLATIHGAKGLEFPHVFLLFLEQSRSFPFYVPSLKSNMSFSQAELAFWDKYGSPEAARITEAWEKEKERVENEKANLLYVALTRATHSLSIFVKKKKSADKSSKEPSEDLTEKLISIVEQSAFSAQCARSGDDTSWKTDYGPRRREESGEIMKIEPARFPAPADLTGNPVELDRSFVSERVREGIERGERIHAFLATLGSSLEIPAAHGLLPAELDAVSAFLGDPEVAGIVFRPGKVYAEQAVSNRQRYGVVDRMLIDEALITVIDFKTGAPGELLDSYREQLIQYADILKSLYPDRSIEAFLLFVDLEQRVLKVELGAVGTSCSVCPLQ